MLKCLPVFILLLLFFGTVGAQKKTDSITTHPVTDTVAKPSPVDSAINHTPADSVVKHPPDSVKKFLVKDTVAKQLPDTNPRHVSADSVMKPAKDSAARHQPIKNIPKKAPTGAVIKRSPVKTLSDERYNALLKGDDIDNLSLVAEINNYPHPDKALKYKVQLGLNPGQITKLKDISAALHRKKVEMGENIIKNEKMLDSLFSGHKVVDGTIIFYTNRYGLYQGEIRTAILMACYKTEDILSAVQIRKLASLEQAVK